MEGISIIDPFPRERRRRRRTHSATQFLPGAPPRPRLSYALRPRTQTQDAIITLDFREILSSGARISGKVPLTHTHRASLLGANLDLSSKWWL